MNATAAHPIGSSLPHPEDSATKYHLRQLYIECLLLPAAGQLSTALILN